MNGARSAKTGTTDTTLNAAATAALSVLLIDARQAAAMLRLGRRKLWSLTICGAIPSRRIGRAVRYSPAELQAWIDGGCSTEPRGGRR